MNRVRILVDVDGPLTLGFFATACAYLREEGVHMARRDRIDRWDIFAAFNTPKDIENRVRERLCSSGVAQEFAPRYGAGKFVDSLRRWADVYAVTAPLDGSPTWAYDREIWLRDRLGLASDRVISARDKSIIDGDVLIDDRVSTLEAWRRPGRTAILWDEPHNRNESWTGMRSHDYESVSAYAKAMWCIP